AAVAGGVPVPFSVLPSSSSPIGATNPQYTGDLIPQPFTPLSGDVGDASSIDLEWSIAGWTTLPTTNETPAPPATGATAGTPGPWPPAGSPPPADAPAAETAAITATPATAWTTGEYMQGSTAGTAGEMHWD